MLSDAFPAASFPLAAPRAEYTSYFNSSGKGYTGMEEKAAGKLENAPETFKPSAGDPLLDRAREINDQIALRAYQLFEAGGFAHGHEHEHWVLAESEILQHVRMDLAETETEITIRAEVPGFKEKDLEVRVSPLSIVISGKRQETTELKEGKAVISERRAAQIYRLLDLPSQVDPNRVTATMIDGVLDIKLMKIGTGKKVPVLAKAAGA